jgi:hypothetical protein
MVCKKMDLSSKQNIEASLETEGIIRIPALSYCDTTVTATTTTTITTTSL